MKHIGMMVLVLAVSGCAPDGSDGGACFPNQTCNLGLSCNFKSRCFKSFDAGIQADAGIGLDAGSTCALSECDFFESCQNNGNGSSCQPEPLKVLFTIPPNPTLITNKRSFFVMGTVVLNDGGMIGDTVRLPAVLPVTYSTNLTGGTKAVVTPDGIFGFAARAVETVGVGLYDQEFASVAAGSTSNKLNVTLNLPELCRSPCSIGEECAPISEAAGERCQSVPLVVSIVPSTNPIGRNRGLAFGLISKADGGTTTDVVFPERMVLSANNSSILFTAATATVVDAGFSFSYFVNSNTPRTAFDGGMYSATVTAFANLADGGRLSGAKEIQVDLVPPSVNVALVPRVSASGPLNGIEYKRDEAATVRVISTEGLTSSDGGSLTMEIWESSPSARHAVNDSTECDAGTFCREFRLPFWIAPMNAMMAYFNAELQGAKDLRGVSVEHEDFEQPVCCSELQVTRLRWQIQPQEDAGLFASPVLDSSGNVYVGTQRPSSNGSIFAFNQLGLPATNWPDAGVTVGSVVSLSFAKTRANGIVDSDTLYFNANAPTGARIGAVVNGVKAATECRPNNAVQKTYASMALVQMSPDVVSAVGTFNYEPGYANSWVCAWNANANAPTVNALSAGAGDSTPMTPVPTNLIILPFSMGANRWKLLLPSIGGVPSGSVLRLVPFSNQGVFATSSASTQSGSTSDVPELILGTAHANFAGADHFYLSSNGGFFHLTNQTTTQVTFPDGGIPSSGSTPTIGQSTVHSMIERTLNRATLGGSTLQVPAGFQGGVQEPAFNSSLLGGTESTGHVYAVTVSGKVAIQSRATGVESSLSVPGPVSLVVASPTLARNTLNPNSETGILYVASTGGQLTAIIVDDAYTDCTVPWPKWQKDIFNSGNSTFNVAAGGSCP
jgi:hypothetical protein